MAVTDLWVKRDKTRSARYGKGLRYRVTVPGHPAKSFRVKDAAKAYELKLLTLGPERPAAEVTVGELLDLYEATKAGLSAGARSSIASGVKHARERWGDVLVDQVERHEVEAWLGALSYERRHKIPGSSPARYETRIHPASRTLREKSSQALSGALAIAVRRELVPRNEAAGISLAEVERRDPKFLSIDELQALSAAAGPHWQPMVMFLGTTALRIGEACSRNVGDVRKVDKGKWRVRVTGTKGRRARDVPIPASVVAMLDLDRPAGTPLFVYPTTGERVQRAPFRNRVFGPAATRVGLPGLHVHDLRHTAISLAIAAGADVKKVQEMAGHKRASMTLDLYGHLWETGLDDVASRVDDMLSVSRARSA